MVDNENVRTFSIIHRLHSADDHAVTWLQEVAVKAFAKWNEMRMSLFYKQCRNFSLERFSSH